MTEPPASPAHSRLSWYAILFFCIAAAVVYGVLHDMVTAHLCVEYFTIAHPPKFHTTSPALLALCWGAAATWWVGAFLGIGLASCCELGKWPRLGLRDVVKPVLVTLVVVGMLAFTAGAIGYRVGIGEDNEMGWMLEGIPARKMHFFAADCWAHLASYIFGALGGSILSAWALLKRRSLISSASNETTRSGA